MAEVLNVDKDETEFRPSSKDTPLDEVSVLVFLLD